MAMVDTNYCFLLFSTEFVGSTHDSIVYAVSALAGLLSSHALPIGFWVCGYEAFDCTNYLIIPFAVSAAVTPGYMLGFNYFLSSYRVHI